VPLMFSASSPAPRPQGHRCPWRSVRQCSRVPPVLLLLLLKCVGEAWGRGAGKQGRRCSRRCRRWPLPAVLLSPTTPFPPGSATSISPSPPSPSSSLLLSAPHLNSLNWWR
jgi:hypothetical protein